MTANWSRRIHALNDYPEGTVSAHEFATKHGVPVKALRKHIVDGVDGECIEATTIPYGCDKLRVRRYLTPEQQSKALRFWDKHQVTYRKQ